MNSIEKSMLFPSGTVIAAYKGKMLGGVTVMPQWEIKPLVIKSSHLSSFDGALAHLTLGNSISLEFIALNPESLDSPHDFNDSPGVLKFVPLDPENKVACYFPLARLKATPEIKADNNISWCFEILCDGNDVFMQKRKANNQKG